MKLHFKKYYTSSKMFKKLTFLPSTKSKKKLTFEYNCIFLLFLTFATIGDITRDREDMNRK